MEILRYSLKEWEPLARNAHLACFAEDRPHNFNTFDYALMVVHSDKPQCYSTIIELDKESAYMQHGGTFPPAKGTAMTAKGYFKMIQYLRERYDNASTRIENKNVPMLKLAMGAGFIINGIDYHNDGSIYLHLYNDFSKGVQ